MLYESVCFIIVCSFFTIGRQTVRTNNPGKHFLSDIRRRVYFAIRQQGTSLRMRVVTSPYLQRAETQRGGSFVSPVQARGRRGATGQLTPPKFSETCILLRQMLAIILLPPNLLIFTSDSNVSHIKWLFFFDVRLNRITEHFNLVRLPKCPLHWV